jgi:hypothetical protein
MKIIVVRGQKVPCVRKILVIEIAAYIMKGVILFIVIEQDCMVECNLYCRS